MTRKALLLALTCMVSMPAMAGTTTSTEVEPASTAKPDPSQKIICRYINSTGSRLSRNKVCQTRAQWDDDADAMRDDVEHNSQRGTGDAMNKSH